MSKLLLITSLFLGLIFSTSTLAQTGIVWNSIAPAQNNNWSSICFGNGVYVAVSTSGTNRVMTSFDGTNWTARTAAANNAWNSVTYGNGLFVAVASSGTGNRVMTSPDGITWTARTSPADNSWFSVTYGNNLFVAIAQAGSSQVMTSPDGVNWTLQASAPSLGWTSVIFANNMYVAVGFGVRKSMMSTDGINWTLSSSNQWASSENPISVTAGIVSGSNRFVMVHDNGPDRAHYSTDGLNWTPSTTSPTNLSWTSVAWGNGLFVALAKDASGNVVSTSIDGNIWTGSAPDEYHNWRALTYTNDRFVAVGTGLGNTVMTSGCDFVVPSVAGTYNSSTNLHADGSTLSYGTGCTSLGQFTDASGGNVLGNTTMTTVLQSTVFTSNPDGFPYVRRSYSMTPTSNGGGTIRMYFTQEDFDDYNANNYGYMDLPTSGNNSDPNKQYVRLANETGGTYTISSSLGVNLTWNGTHWEITKLVTSLTGSVFYLTTLPSCEGITVDGLAISNINGTGATATWTAISPNPTSGWYSLRFKPTASGTWIDGGTAGYASTSKIFNNLTPSTEYEIQIRRNCSTDGAGDWSTSVLFSTLASTCGTPMVFNSPSTAANTLTVTWPAIAGAAWLEFEYKETSSGTWLSAGTKAGSATTKTIIGLLPSTSYDVRGRSFCPNGIASNWSSIATASTTSALACSLPPVLTNTALTTSSATMTWPTVAGAAWFEFRYKESISGTWISAGTLNGAGVTKTLSGLNPATDYDFQAKSFCADYVGSAWSSTLQFTTASSMPLQPKPGTDLANDKALENTNINVIVYPNPTSDIVNIETVFEEANTLILVKVIDMNGRIVLEMNSLSLVGKNTIQLSLGNLNIGIYNLELYNNNVLIDRSKVIKTN